jgi:hypothetical protein
MRQILLTTMVICLFFLAIIYPNLFPGNIGIGIIQSDKPVILYGGPFQASNFSKVVSFAALHGFNTLMVLAYIDHKQVLNDSVLQNLSSIVRSKNVTLVPSVYIMSMNDMFDANEFSRINLDMEKLSPNDQSSYYSNISGNFSLVSVTMAFGVPQMFYSKMMIVEI